MVLGACLVVLVPACGSTCQRVARLEQRVARLEARLEQKQQTGSEGTRPAAGVGEQGWFISGGGRHVYSATMDRETVRAARRKSRSGLG